MMRFLGILACLSLFAGAGEAATAPRGATIGKSGFATIVDAPPAPFVPVRPSPPPGLTPEQLAAHAQFRRVAEFQNKVRDEVERLAARLRRAEPKNFVDLYYENEGDPSVVFRFLRNGAATLRKYSRNPAFTGNTVRYSREELRAAQDFMFKAFAEDRVIQGGGTGSKENRAVIDISISEPEFRALAARKGVRIPDAVKLNFWGKEPMQALNQPLRPDLARLVRMFPRDDRPVGAVNAINSTAKIILDDGCFRVAGAEPALALLPQGAQLFIDRDGYLAFGSADMPDYARVGEEVVFEGSIVIVAAPELVRPIHAACGPGKVVKINGLRSAAADRAQRGVEANFQALRSLKETYGLSDALARRALEVCRKRGSGTCMLTPPNPVVRQQGCPAGTKLSYGLCRTPEGYVRPLPKWIQELAGS